MFQKYLKISLVTLLLVIGVFNVMGFEEEGIDYRWDPQDFILNPGFLPLVTDNIIDCYIHSPEDAWSTAIDFRTAFLINEQFTFALYGSFFNNLNDSNDQDDKTWYEDANGNPTVVETHTKERFYDWNAINNVMYALLGWKYSDSLYLGFRFGGGTSIPDFYKKSVDYLKTFTAAGVLSAAYDDETMLNKRGFGFIYAQVAINFRENFFSNGVFHHLRLNQHVRVDVAGNGSVTGGSSQQTLTSTYNTANTLTATSTDESKYRYTGLYYGGNLAGEIPLHKLVNALAALDKFSFIFQVNYQVGFRIYSAHEEFLLNKNEVSGDYTLDQSTGPNSLDKIKFYMNSTASIPLFFNIYPINAVQISFGYSPGLNLTTSFRHATDYDENRVGGVLTTITGPTNKIWDTNITITHGFMAQFQFVFPKLVRLTLGGNYTLTQTIQYDKDWYDDDVETTVTGGVTTTAPAGVVIDKNISTTHTIAQAINPYLGLDFELFKGMTVIQLTWNPKMAFNDTADSNILNLACWTISTVIKFNKKKSASTSSTVSEDVVE